MKEVLQKLSNETLQKLQYGLDNAYIELKVRLGEYRFDNEIYLNILWLSNLMDSEYLRRQSITDEEASKHNLNYNYSRKLNQE